MAYRTTYIQRALDVAVAEGVVRTWYSYSPDGRKRWVVEWRSPLSERVYTTAEAGAMADALTCAREARFGYPAETR